MKTNKQTLVQTLDKRQRRTREWRTDEGRQPQPRFPVGRFYPAKRRPRSRGAGGGGVDTWLQPATTRPGPAPAQSRGRAVPAAAWGPPRAPLTPQGMRRGLCVVRSRTTARKRATVRHLRTQRFLERTGDWEMSGHCHHRGPHSAACPPLKGRTTFPWRKAPLGDSRCHHGQHHQEDAEVKELKNQTDTKIQ